MSNPTDGGITYGEVAAVSYWGDCREHRIYVSTVFPKRHPGHQNWQLSLALANSIEHLISDHYAAGNNRITGRDQPIARLTDIPADVTRTPGNLVHCPDGSLCVVYDINTLNGTNADHVQVSFYGPNCDHSGGRDCIGLRSLGPQKMELRYEWRAL